MSILDGFEVMEVPSKSRCYGRHRAAKVMEAFLDSGEPCMGRDYGDADDARAAWQAYNRVAKRGGYPVKVARRGGMLYLMRDDTAEMGGDA